MVLQGEEAIVYLYVLNDKKQHFDVNKMEFSKNSGEFKKVEVDEEENDEKDKKEEENNNNIKKGEESVSNANPEGESS